MGSFGNTSLLYSFLNRQLGVPVWKLAGKRYGMMANNYFSKVNKGIFRNGKFIRDFGELVLSEGELLNPDGMTVEPLENGAFRVTWTPEDGMRTRDKGDRLMVLVVTEYSEEYLDFGIEWAEEVSGERGEGAGRFSIPGHLRDYLAKEREKAVEHGVHAYCFFGAADGSAYSKSKYFPLNVKKS